MSPWYCRLRRLDRLYTWESMNWTIIAATILITTELARPLLEQRSRRLRKVAIGLALFVIAGFAFAQQRQGAAPGSRFSAVDEQQLRAVTASVREAILSENVDLLLQNTSPVRGLRCTDTTYSYERITSFLRNKNSHLYKSLFDSSGFARQCGREYPPEYPPISEKEFLRSASNSSAIVRIDNDWAKVTLTSPVRNQYSRDWYFHREAGAWKLSDASFVIGNCSCG
jgi:hypothetical protein